MNAKALLVFVGLIVFCVATFGIFASMVQPQMTTGTVNMVQPCGWFWCMQYDREYSEINVNNSQSNQNNGEANLLNAQATQVVGGTATVRNQQVGFGFVMGICGAGLALLALVVIVLPVLGRVVGS
jgi:hypothetical protein